MHQNELPSNSMIPLPSATGLDAGSIPHPLVGVGRFIASLRRRKSILFLCLALCFTLGGAYYMTAERKYESSAELLLLDLGNNALKNDDSGNSSVKDSIPTNKMILVSDSILREVITKLPREHRIDFKGIPQRNWLDTLRSGISVSSTRNTTIIRIRYRSKHPETAVLVVENIVESYLQYMQQTHKDSAREQLEVLTTEKNSQEKNIRKKEALLLLKKGQSQVLLGTGDSQVNVVNDRVVELNHSFVEAQKKHLDAKSFLLSIETAIRNGDDIQQFAMQASQEVGSELLKRRMGVGSQDSWIMAQTQKLLLEDKTELQNKLNSLGPKNPIIIRLEQNIRARENWIRSQTTALGNGQTNLNNANLSQQLLKMARHRFLLASSHLKEIELQFQKEKQQALGLNQSLAELQILSMDIVRMRNYYDLLVKRISEIDIGKQSGMRATSMTPPKLNPTPVTPRLSMTILLSLMAGIGLGCGIIYIIDALDDRFQSPDDLRRELGVPILTMVRQFRELNADGLPGVLTFMHPNSVETEAFRTLRTTIEFSGNEMRRISISSTQPSDGKTTVLSNLAVAYAQSGKRTLIIDGDMRRPGLTRLFAYRGPKGLSALLKSNEPFDQIFGNNIIETELENLDVVPAGPRPINPVELLTSDRLAELLSWAEGHYDQILIDAPPALAVADPAIIGRVVDGSILTVQPGKNKRKMVLRAAEALTSLGAQMTGIVVNKLSDDSSEYGYGYGYGYGAEYGHDEADHENQQSHDPEFNTNNYQQPDENQAA